MAGRGKNKGGSKKGKAAHPVEEETALQEPAARSAGLRVQDWVGLTLIFASMLGVGIVGVWFGGNNPIAGLHFWAGRAAIQGVSIALIALFIWALLAHRRAVSYALVLGICAVGIFGYDAASAWRIDRERLRAGLLLAEVERGDRNIDSLTEVEKGNPYVEAWLIMRELYWELNALTSDRMSGYRSAYEEYTANGGFLDIGRLRNEFDLWYSLVQIQDLEALLTRIEATPLDAVDTRWSLRLLRVDPITKAAYADDLARGLNSVTKAQSEAIARERQTLRLMRNALETLLAAEDRYRIEDDRVIFENPDDAAKFAGKGI